MNQDMNQDKFSQQIITLQQHLLRLHKQLATVDSSPIQALLLREIVLATIAFEELCSTLEDLLVTHEELSQSNEHLAAIESDRQPDTNSYQPLPQQIESFQQRIHIINEQLEATVEALEISDRALEDKTQELLLVNEQLQAKNVQIKSTDAKLGARNEDLQISAEQLDTSNQQLQIATEDLRLCSEDINQSNAFLKSIFTSLPGGIIVLNQQMNIQIWNRQAEDLWGLRNDEVQGQPFLNLDIGLPVEQLRQPIQSCLTGDLEYYEETLEAINRRGRKIQCKVTCIPLVTLKKDIQGVIVLTQEFHGVLPTL